MSLVAAAGDGHCTLAMHRSALLLLLVVVEDATAPAAANPPAGRTPPSLRDAYDLRAFLVPPRDAASLQRLLDQHKAVRLLPGDYTPNCTSVHANGAVTTNCSFPRANLTVRSGQQIWGLPGATLPSIVVEAGSTDVTLSELSFKEGMLFFAPGDKATQYSTFHRIQGAQVVFGAGAKVSDCSFVGLTNVACRSQGCGNKRTAHSVAMTVGGIHAEVGSSVSNCKFIRSMVHGPWPLLTIRTKQWVGNTFLWTNVLGALQSSFSATDAAELTIVGPDMETYGACWVLPAIQAESAGSVRLYGPHGRIECHPQNSSLPHPTPVMALDAEKIWISTPSSMPVSRPGAANADIVLGPSVQDYLRVDRSTDAPWKTQSDPEARPALRLKLSSNNSVELGGSPSRSGALPATDQATLAAMVASPSGRGTWSVASAPASLPPLPQISVGIRDDTAKLQRMIDSWVVTPHTPQVVPAGTYYISKPLRVGRLPDPAGNTTACLARAQVRMLVGAGRDNTFILARDPTMTMVTIDGCYPNGGHTGDDKWRPEVENSRFHVSGVTLAGGAVGFHFSAATGHHQITDSMISHVRFRELSKYGIWLDDIFGLDNNLLSFLSFDKCKVAFFQRAPDSQRISPGGRCKQAWWNPFLGYMDKVVFYRVEVTNCQTGFQLDACRADNLNYWVENAMVNVSGAGWDLQHNSEATVVSSLVENVAAIDGVDGMINSHVIAGVNTQYMLPNSIKVEGSSFVVSKDANSHISLFKQQPPSTTGTPSFESWPSFSMSRSRVGKGLPLPKLMRDTILFNNRFEDSADSGLNKMAVSINGSTTNALSSAHSEEQPSSALCFGPAW